MIRSTSFHAAMARLALVAMLLLAAMPTLGRFAASGMQPASAGWAALCTASGLKYVDLSLHGATHADDGTTPQHPGGHDGPDCAYCPLLVLLLVASVWMSLLRACGIRGPLATTTPAPACKLFHPNGLGSRGPPLIS